jgi:serine protease Do
MLIQTLFALALAVRPLASPVAAGLPGDSTVPNRASFGVAIAPVSAAFRATDYLEPNEGVVLAKVEAGSAAAAAQLKEGDIVLAINGKRVDETTLFAAIRAIPRGEAFKVEYLHDLRWKETWATIG